MSNLIADNNRVIRGFQTYKSVANTKVGIESVRINCSAPVEDQTVEGYEVLRHPKYGVYLDIGSKPGSGPRCRTARPWLCFRRMRTSPYA